MRFLCLHGVGTNSQILQLQTAAIRSELGDPFTHAFEFVDGGLQWPLAAGFQNLNIQSEDCCAFYDTDSAETILAALDDLADFVTETGPYDGLLGFSQGAVLAAMLLIRQGHKTSFRCAVFICAGIPFAEGALEENKVEYLGPEKDGVGIHIPTAHIYGSRDENWDHALVLSKLCQDRGKAVYAHGAGHEIPRAPRGVTEEMSRVIEEVIAKATIGQ